MIKEELQTEKEPKPRDNEKDNLVPESENPFLQENIPSNGDGREMKVEDYYENAVLTGQKDEF